MALKQSGAAKKPGVFVFSLDTELAWGSMHHGSYAGHEADFARTRDVIGRVLEMFEKYQVRGTWAVVGHLFLESCAETAGVKHPEVIRPRYSWFSGDWFARDPASTVREAPWWYGPDIIGSIRACKVHQEIGCHNFSHIIVGDPGCSADAFRSELAACRTLAERSGTDLKSFVFPRNSIGHLDVLRQSGFTSYRGVAPAWPESLPGPLAKVGRLVDSFLPVPAPVTQPVLTEGLWDLKASYFYRHRNGWARMVPVGVQVRKAVLSLRRAAHRGATFHLWTHPFNIASDPEALLRGLERILQEAKNLSDSGLLVSRTMSEVVETQMAGSGTPGGQVRDTAR
jgi:peptidoglycan/xylan/chitin deacetylase (PgdA/CDA1 family)